MWADVDDTRLTPVAAAQVFVGAQRMQSIDEREKNLFNATDTLAQFYDEIESFLDILFGSMERLGYAAKAERLRSGTVTVKNLSRRLLATANVIYVKGVGQIDDALEEDEPEEDGESEKAGKEEVSIHEGLKIPFVHISLFAPNTIPSVRTLSRPVLHCGAIGEMSFVEKKTSKPAKPDSPKMTLSNLANFRFKSARKKGDQIRIPCWNPTRMRKYKMEARLLGFESQRLLEIDSQEKIRAIAEKLAEYDNA